LTSVVANRNFTCGGRLFQRLQQRVEGVLGEHVHFVDDIDLVARRDGGIAYRLDDLAHVVDAGVGSGVHLDHVDVAALGDRLARLALPARVDRRAALPIRPDAIERLGNEPRGGGLADTAHAGHQEGMGQAPRRIALPSVCTIASCPISSPKVCGRYLRASTR
jgi:hypothetical protein